jgi:hypothetical protein
LVIFSTFGYDSGKVITQVRKHLGREVQLFGGTSSLGVVTRDGFHMGKKGSLALLGIFSKRIDFGVGESTMDGVSPREAGRKAMMQAIKHAGRGEKKPNLILIYPTPGAEENILKGIADVIGEEVPVFGGAAADNTIEGLWKVFAGEKIYDKGVALTAIYTDLKIGYAFQSGYLRTTQRGVITKAKGRIIYEINGRPAAEVYNEWIGGRLSEKLKIGGSILMDTTFWPLAKVLKGREGQTHYLSIHPLSFNLPEKSLSVFSNVEIGDEISLLSGGWEVLLSRVSTTTIMARTKGNLSKEEVAWGIMLYCAGNMLSIPEKERPKMVSLVKQTLGNAPFIGAFTFGEQGFLPGVGNHHGNLINSMIIMGKN